ncbi:MAG: NADAR family protein [Chitinophagales bacterium]|nr:NADAR family protein [Chitinophagales bacterium]
MKNSKYQERTYLASESVCFKKTKEAFGGLSNMAAGFLLQINDVPILTSEALYQCCRFPHLPDLQKLIIAEKSPMTAKMLIKPYKEQSRKDFDESKVDIMRWCLRVKLAQNFIEFGNLLLSTNNQAIVEDSVKDTFWGAVRDKNDDNILRGINALGRLLMELRKKYTENPFAPQLFYIEPPKIANFKLLGQEIGIVDERTNFLNTLAKKFSQTNT